MILLLGLSLGFGAALAVEGKMLHLRHFLPGREPAWTQDLSDGANLRKIVCGFAAPQTAENPPGILSVAGILAALGDGCQF